MHPCYIYSLWLKKKGGSVKCAIRGNQGNYHIMAEHMPADKYPTSLNVKVLYLWYFMV